MDRPSAILNPLWDCGTAVLKARASGFCHPCFIEDIAAQHVFDVMRAPGNRCDPAQGDANLVDEAAIELQRHRRRSNSKLVGLTIAYFQVEGAAGPGAGRNDEFRYDFVWLQVGFKMGGVTRLPMERTERNRACAIRTNEQNSSIERQKACAKSPG